jgi:HK97 family phage major capsid protein
MQFAMMIAGFMALLAVHFVSPHSIDLQTVGFAFGTAGGILSPQEFRTGLKEIKDAWEKDSTEFKTRMDNLDAELRQAQQENARLRRQILSSVGKSPSVKPGEVSEDCAKWLAAIYIKCAEVQGKLESNKNKDSLIKEADEILKRANDSVKIAQRSTLTSSDIPLPVLYGSEVVELVWQYGAARKYMTVYPLGVGSVKLPRLKTSPAFGFIDIAAAAPEKSPQIEFVDFVAKKAGGIIRFPSEIESDSIVKLGQFLARYIAREFAKWEDETAFLGDGSATYKTIEGVTKRCDTLGKKLQLATGNTGTDDITLANLRTLRGIVDGAALQSAAYYMHASMEGLLSGFNSGGTNPYNPQGLGGPRLDGYLIRFVGNLLPFSTTAQVNKYPLVFGDLSYWYFGEVGSAEIAVSRDVYFATDEVAIRALERFDVHSMADTAMAVLQLAAS